MYPRRPSFIEFLSRPAAWAVIVAVAVPRIASPNRYGSATPSAVPIIIPHFLSFKNMTCPTPRAVASVRSSINFFEFVIVVG